jgi:hypothetical protein
MGAALNSGLGGGGSMGGKGMGPGPVQSGTQNLSNSGWNPNVGNPNFGYSQDNQDNAPSDTPTQNITGNQGPAPLPTAGMGGNKSMPFTGPAPAGMANGYYGSATGMNNGQMTFQGQNITPLSNMGPVAQAGTQNPGNQVPVNSAPPTLPTAGGGGKDMVRQGFNLPGAQPAPVAQPQPAPLAQPTPVNRFAPPNAPGVRPQVQQPVANKYTRTRIK